MELLSIAVGETASSASARLHASLSQTSPYFNRELSWLEFNHRVLEEALDERHPLLERVKFLSIFSTNLDEFFMIRVAGIKQQIAAGVATRSPDGMTPAEQLSAIRQVVERDVATQRSCWLDDLQPRLCAQGISVLDYGELNEEQRAFCTAYFEREVFAVLTPLAFDPSHPFPHISNLSINLAVVIRDVEEGELFARVKVPAVLPRLIELAGGQPDASSTILPERRHCFVWLDQVIAANVAALFPGMEVVEAYDFRVTRNADLEIQEEEAADLLRTIEQGVRARRFGAVVRLTVEHDMPQRIRELLLANLKLTPDDLYEVQGPLGLADLMALTNIERPDLKNPPLSPVLPSSLRHARSSAEIFAAIRAQDILLHHPFDSFQPLVELIEADASDLFNFLTGYSRQRRYRKLLVAPVNLRERLTALIEREIVHASSGRGGRLIFKLNAVVDPTMIDLLYRAAQAGVQIGLIARGICCLRPGVSGLSETISVRSVVGRFLEHSRIYYFANGGDPEVYLGSADLMQRNLDRRVETLFPIEDPALVAHIHDKLLMVYLNDNTRARILLPDGSYVRARHENGAALIDSQAIFATGQGAPPDDIHRYTQVPTQP